MHSSNLRDILEYPAASALCSWVGNVLSKNIIGTSAASFSAEASAVIQELDTTLPAVLPELSTVPLTFRAHQRP